MVDFRIIEIIERVFDANAEMIVSITLANPVKVRRTQIADVIAEWLSLDGQYKRREVREYVITAPAENIRQYVGCIQAAVLWSLAYIDDDQFTTLTKGEDLPTEDDLKKSTDSPKGATG